jgi:hypothetical protein
MLDMEREIPHVQRRFLEIYRELSDVDLAREALPHLSEDVRRVSTDGLKRLGKWTQ